MKPASAQNLLSALAGKRRVTIGLEAPDELRRLSDARALTCPGCRAPVVLHAGTVRAHHFAHLPGAVCTLPQTEPETEEHRAGKLLLARWLRDRLPAAEIVVEAHLPETGQRADVLAILPSLQGKPRRLALEYQCANLSAREWRRRHRLYQEAGIEDLWFLGGSRLHFEPFSPPATLEDTENTEGTQRKTGRAEELERSKRLQEGSRQREGRKVEIRTTELERALLWDGAPLLYLDAVGERLPAETLARFRPDAEAQALRPMGRLIRKNLLTLDFPFHLLDWGQALHPEAPVGAMKPSPALPRAPAPVVSDAWLWEWLTNRFRITPETLADFFGLPVFGQDAFACEARAWQAAIYYRFVHQRVGDSWWLAEVETWARAHLPVARPVNPRKLKGALSHYQELLAAAGMLSLPMGYGRVNARIQADLTTLREMPDREETLRLARYRRTLTREDQATYACDGEHT